MFIFGSSLLSYASKILLYLDINVTFSLTNSDILFLLYSFNVVFLTVIINDNYYKKI